MVHERFGYGAVTAFEPGLKKGHKMDSKKTFTITRKNYLEFLMNKICASFNLSEYHGDVVVLLGILVLFHVLKVLVFAVGGCSSSSLL